jgi:hypothetical protein
MRIATSLAFLLAASILPAHAQRADDVGSSIQTSQYSQFGPFRTAHRAHGPRRGAGGASASRGCLTGDTRALLSRFEARFGSVKVI